MPLYYPYVFDTVDFDYSQVGVKVFETGPASYKILNYLPNVDPAGGIYRSVVVDEKTNKLLSVSPVQTIPFSEFVAKHPVATDDIQCNEMVEGTLIHLFCKDGVWEIATKGTVGGNYWFYRTHYNDDGEKEAKPQKTFRNMLYDALRIEYDTPLQDIPFISELSPEYCYSFVLQHPDNHIVYRIPSASLTLVSAFHIMEISETKFGVSLIPQKSYRELFPWLNTFAGLVNMPTMFDVDGLDVREDIVSLPLERMGVVYTNTRTGERTKIDNAQYQLLRELRGNNPNLQYQYFVLAKLGRVSEFLECFPQYREQFARFHRQYNAFITQMHNLYVLYFIQHVRTPILKKWFVHISRIHHTIYLPSLSNERIIIKRPVVKQYFDSLEPGALLYAQ
jgi:hypothetical protein